MVPSRQPQICCVNTPISFWDYQKAGAVTAKQLQLRMDGCDWCLLLMHCSEGTRKKAEKSRKKKKNIYILTSSFWAIYEISSSWESSDQILPLRISWSNGMNFYRIFPALDGVKTVGIWPSLFNVGCPQKLQTPGNRAMWECSEPAGRAYGPRHGLQEQPL